MNMISNYIIIMQMMLPLLEIPLFLVVSVRVRICLKSEMLSLRLIHCTGSCHDWISILHNRTGLRDV